MGSALLDLSDDPLVPRGFGSRLFDGEGIAARRMPVFERGVLKTYYVDTYYGRKLGLPPTTGGSSNAAWALGATSQAALLAEMKDGILVTGFLGGNSNSTTGDFSFGVQGYRVRGGKRRGAGRRDEHLRQPDRPLEAADRGRQRPVSVLAGPHADAGVRRRAVRRELP